MKKEYYNQEAYNYIENEINKTKIDPVFKPIVIDIILRRRSEYQLDDKYFQRDVKSFVNNVKSISWDKMPRSAAIFDAQQKCVRINQNLFKGNIDDKQAMEVLLEALSHECGHAMMDADEKGNDRTFKNDPTADIEDSIVDNAGTLEIFNEKEADRIIYNRNSEDAFKYHNRTNAYPANTMLVNAIAAAFGLKEKDLLSAAIKGEQELYEALDLNIKDEDFSKKKFNDISLNIRISHIEIYKGKSDEIDYKNIGRAYAQIYKNLEQVLAYRINNLEWKDPSELQEKIEDIKLSQNAISSIMDDEELQTPEKRAVYAKVMCMEEIVKNNGENSKELISFVQKSENVEELLEHMQQNGIEIDYEKLTSMPEFSLSQKKKDEWIKEFCLDGEEWDNTEIINYMIENKEKITNAREKTSFADKIKRGILAVSKFSNKFYGKVFSVPKKILALLRKNSNEEPLLLEERKRRKTRG